MANKNIIGTFVFRNEGDGCLTSKYFHGNQDYPYVEACKLYDNGKDQADIFSGRYKTTWIENPNHQAVNCDLKITWNQQQNTYTLNWIRDNRTIFEGIGMIYDELLVGAYWD